MVRRTVICREKRRFLRAKTGPVVKRCEPLCAPTGTHWYQYCSSSSLPSIQLRVHRHQRLGSRPYERRRAQDEPLAGRDTLLRHQAVCGTGGVSMPGGSSDGSSRQPRFAHLRCIADDAPIGGGECGIGQGALAVGGDKRRRISSWTPQGLSTSSTSHRVSPVCK
jgi:hypothetical protein